MAFYSYASNTMPWLYPFTGTASTPWFYPFTAGAQTVFTLFAQAATGSSLAADATAYTMGVQFTVTGSGHTLTGMWFYSAAGASVLPQTIALFAVSGTSLITSQAATWSGAAGSGWVRAPWTSPPVLTAATGYKACVFQSTAVNWYSSTAHYWDTGAGSGGITSGPVTAPNNAGATPGQESFDSNNVLGWPNGSFNATNYWVDLEVTL